MELKLLNLNANLWLGILSSLLLTFFYLLIPLVKGDYLDYLSYCTSSSAILCGVYYKLSYSLNPYFLIYTILAILSFPKKVSYLSFFLWIIAVWSLIFIQFQALKSALSVVLLYKPLNNLVNKQQFWSYTNLILVICAFEAHYSSILALLIILIIKKAPNKSFSISNVKLKSTSRIKKLYIGLLSIFLSVTIATFVYFYTEIQFVLNKFSLYSSLILYNPSMDNQTIAGGSSLRFIGIAVGVILGLYMLANANNAEPVYLYSCAILISMGIGATIPGINRIYWFFLPGFIPLCSSMKLFLFKPRKIIPQSLFFLLIITRIFANY